MAEYVDKAKIVEWFRPYGHASESIPFETLVSDLRDMKAADVTPVVHGDWAHLGGDEWCCTNCREVIHTEGSWEKPTKKFCYECGARMDGERKDGDG